MLIEFLYRNSSMRWTSTNKPPYRDSTKAKANEAKKEAKDTVDKLHETGHKLADDLKAKEKEVSKKLKKDLDETKSFLAKLYDSISERLVATSNYIYQSTSSGLETASNELKNPVVATQAVVAVGAIAGLAAVLKDRQQVFRFKTDGEISAILAGIVGFVALDGFLFNKYYPKYKK